MDEKIVTVEEKLAKMREDDPERMAKLENFECFLCSSADQKVHKYGIKALVGHLRLGHRISNAEQIRAIGEICINRDWNDFGMECGWDCPYGEITTCLFYMADPPYKIYNRSDAVLHILQNHGPKQQVKICDAEHLQDVLETRVIVDEVLGTRTAKCPFPLCGAEFNNAGKAVNHVIDEHNNITPNHSVEDALTIAATCANPLGLGKCSWCGIKRPHNDDLIKFAKHIGEYHNVTPSHQALYLMASLDPELEGWGPHGLMMDGGLTKLSNDAEYDCSSTPPIPEKERMEREKLELAKQE